MGETEASAVEQRHQAALEADVPEIYFNGFINGLNSADITVALERNGKPAAVLNMSFTIAKTFAIALLTTVGQVEDLAKREMLTTHELEALLTAANNKEAERG